jgi:hypothetical protein
MDEKTLTFPIIQERILSKLSANPALPLTEAERQLVAFGLERVRLLLQDALLSVKVYDIVQGCMREKTG